MADVGSRQQSRAVQAAGLQHKSCAKGGGISRTTQRQLLPLKVRKMLPLRILNEDTLRYFLALP